MNYPQILQAWLGRALMVVWFLALSFSMVCWGAWHYAALPSPVSFQLPRTETNQHWKMIHVLATDCGCSAAVAEHLVARHAQSGIFEEVWLVGDSSELNQTLGGAGFHVIPKNSETLAHDMGIEGLPCLLIINPAGRTVYAGGYARQNPATVAALEDLVLLQRAQGGEVPDPLPLFGCAASQRLRLALDPLGLKYSLRPPINQP